jgi:hypothetical protein
VSVDALSFSDTKCQATRKAVMFGESSVVGEVESCEQGFWIIQCQGMKPSRASRGSLDDRNTRTNRGMGVDRVKLLLATAGLLHYAGSGGQP